MQRKTRNRVLLLLLALLFGARTLTAQTGWQFFTVEGRGRFGDALSAIQRCG